MKKYMLSNQIKAGSLVGLLGVLPLTSASLAAEVAQEDVTGAAAEQSQRVAVTGIVCDASTGAPLSGVQVHAFDDKRYSAMTDEEGKYVLSLPTYVTALTISCEGYNAQTLPVNGRREGLDASLYANAFSADYRLQESANQTSSVGINSNNADLSIDNQISSSLGAQIRSVSHSGVPGSGAYMLINGINSLNANAQPLIVLDGVIMDMQYGRSAVHDGFFNNILANVSVDDIAKVTVLRNGTALYGAKGANGVILIDTKRNRSMVTKIDISVAGKYETLPTLPDMMNASEYRTYVSEMLGTTGTKLNNFKFLRDEKDYYYYRVYHNNTDWSKEVYDEAFTQTYSINVQGGDDVANYNLSVGYANADATLIDNSFSRFNLRLNSDVRLSNRVNVRLDASYSDINRDLRDDGVAANITDNTITSPGFLSLIKAPFLNPYAYDTQGNLSSFLADADDYLNEVLGSEASLSNPLSILRNGEADNKNSFGNRLISLGIAPKVDILPGLSVTEHFSFHMINTDENYYLPITGVPEFEVEDVGSVRNIVQSMSSHQYLTTSDTRIDWIKDLGASRLHVNGGFRYSLSNYVLNTMKGYNSGNDKSPNMSTNLSYKTTSGVNERVTTLTYYLLGDYNYGGKYYLNVGVSTEASSRFGKDATSGFKMGGVVWGVFPSVAASWVATNESWFPANDYVNYLKLTAGFDWTGNDDIDLTASRTYFTSVNLLNSVDGVTVGNIGNTSLQWETTKRLTLGADMNLFDNRVSLSGHFFKSKTSDLLSLQQLAYVLGLDESWCNGGALENNGFDVSLCAKVLNLKDFKWEVGASVGHYKNEVTKLPGQNRSFTTSTYGATVLTQVGSPVGLFYGYKTDGVYATTDAAAQDGYYQLSTTGVRQYFGAGDVRFVNANSDNGNKEINEADRVVIGDPNPDIYGNIFTNLKYKHWNLGVVFNYSLGNDVYNYQRSILEGGSYFYNQTTALRNRWMCEGQETSIPKISYEDQMGNSRFSDRWIEDGSYLRMKNVTLSYDWSFSSRYLQGLTVWGAVNNAFTLTKYLGSDPDFSAGSSILSQGIDRGLLSGSRSFSLGIKINL